MNSHSKKEAPVSRFDYILSVFSRGKSTNPSIEEKSIVLAKAKQNDLKTALTIKTKKMHEIKEIFKLTRAVYGTTSLTYRDKKDGALSENKKSYEEDGCLKLLKSYLNKDNYQLYKFKMDYLVQAQIKKASALKNELDAKQKKQITREWIRLSSMYYLLIEEISLSNYDEEIKNQAQRLVFTKKSWDSSDEEKDPIHKQGIIESTKLFANSYDELYVNTSDSEDGLDVRKRISRSINIHFKNDATPPLSRSEYLEKKLKEQSALVQNNCEKFVEEYQTAFVRFENEWGQALENLKLEIEKSMQPADNKSLEEISKLKNEVIKLQVEITQLTKKLSNDEKPINNADVRANTLFPM